MTVVRRSAVALKRCVDAVVGSVALIALAPVLMGVALLVRWRIGSPVLFRQERPGLHGRPFQLVKFRTMTSARHADGRLLPDTVRLTPFGRWLRSTSLDELPELINVVRGDMSLVGPRPLLMAYLPLYSAEQARRHDVQPGITGLAQISGRASLTWDDRFKLDVWYVDHWSLWLDVKIMLRTLRTVLRREGVSSEGLAPLPGYDPDTQR